jgi:hypothetical protein
MVVILVFLFLIFLPQSSEKCTKFSADIFTSGCLNVTETFVKDHAAIIGGAGIGVACLMVTNKLKI